MLHSEVGRTLKCIKFFLNQKSVLLSSAPSVAVFRLPQYVLCHPNCNVCWYKPFRAYDREKTFWITLPTTVSLVAGKQKVPPWESPLEGQVIKAQHLPKVPSSVQLLSHVRLFALYPFEGTLHNLPLDGALILITWFWLGLCMHLASLLTQCPFSAPPYKHHQPEST